MIKRHIVNIVIRPEFVFKTVESCSTPAGAQAHAEAELQEKIDLFLRYADESGLEPVTFRVGEMIGDVEIVEVEE